MRTVGTIFVSTEYRQYSSTGWPILFRSVVPNLNKSILSDNR